MRCSSCLSDRFFRVRGWRRLLAVACVVALTVAMPAEAFAFKPAAHQTLLTEVVEALPADDPFRLAYQYNAQTQKDAAWGALGPDVGLGTLTAPLEYVPWRDSWHADRSGSFAAALLKSAIESGDERRMAYALGYVTHVTGDLALQASLTRPDAGVVFDQPRSNGAVRDKIDTLETAAEAFVWTDAQMGGNPNLTNLSATVFPLSFSQFGSEEDLRTVSNTQYGATPNVKEMMGFTYGVLGRQSLVADIESSLSSIIGGSAAHGVALAVQDLFDDLGLSDWFLNDPRMKLYLDTQSTLTADQKTRVRSAFLLAKQQAVAMLQQAARDDYHGFTDAVTLDVGTTQTAPPALAVVARVKTGTLGDYFGDTLTRRMDGPGTDDDVWIRFTRKDGSVIEKELGFGKSVAERNLLRLGPAADLAYTIDALPLGIGHFNDMEGGRVDAYPLYVPGLALEDIASVGLRKGTGSGALGDGTNGKWRPEYIELSVNGELLPRILVPDWFGQPTTILVPNPTPWDGRGLLVDQVIADDKLVHDYAVGGIWATAQLRAPKPAALASAQATITAEGAVRLSWTAPGAGRVRVLRSEAGGTVARWFADVVGQRLVYEGTGSSVVDTDVAPAKTYVYSTYVINDYEIPSNRYAVTVATKEPVPAAPTALVAVAGDKAVSLSWSNPGDAYFDHAVVVRKAGSAPASVTDGVQVSLKSPVSAVDSGLTNGVTYHYAVFAVNGDGTAGPPARTSAVPVSGADDFVNPGPVTALSVTMGEHTSTVTWANPADADFSMVRVLRSPFGYATNATPTVTVADPYGVPTNLAPADLIKAQWIAYQGPGTGFTDRGLLLSIDELDLSAYTQTVQDYLEANYGGVGVEYFYTVYARDASGRWSTAAKLTATTRDRTPPVTICEGVSSPFSLSPILVWRNWASVFYPWVDHDVTLTLSATDNASGVRAIYYQFDNGEVTTYTAPVNVSSEGTHWIEFWSYDNTGNLDGTVRFIKPDPFQPGFFVTDGDLVKFGIDKSAPTASSNAVASYVDTATITLTAVDLPTNTATVRYLLDSVPGQVSSGGTVVTGKPGSHELTFWPVDRVGHVGTAQTVVFTVRNNTALTVDTDSGLVPYGAMVDLRAFLTAPGGSMPASQAVVFEKREGAGTWEPIGTAMTDEHGAAGVGALLTANATVRARYAGAANLLASTSAEVPLEVLADIPTPAMPSGVQRGITYECTTTISPKKTAGTAAVTMDCYHFESGSWVLRASLPATATDLDPATSLLTAEVNLPLAGTWRICAHYPGDAANAETYSGALEIAFREQTAITMTVPSKVYYGRTATATGTLKTATGTPLGERDVTLQVSSNGSTWGDAATVRTQANGTWSAATPALTAKRYVRAVFRGDFDFGPSTSSGRSVWTTVYLTNPVAPSTARVARAFTVAGYLKPRHTAGTYPVRIYKYRYQSGRWVSYGYVTARAYDYSTWTKYSRSITLPKTGTWRLRAYAPADSWHAATWSSGYDTVKVY